MSPLHVCNRIFGTCRYQSYCWYQRVAFPVCLHHARGTCKFGSMCRFSHDVPPFSVPQGHTCTLPARTSLSPLAVPVTTLPPQEVSTQTETPQCATKPTQTLIPHNPQNHQTTQTSTNPSKHTGTQLRHSPKHTHTHTQATATQDNMSTQTFTPTSKHQWVQVSNKPSHTQAHTQTTLVPHHHRAVQHEPVQLHHKAVQHFPDLNPWKSLQHTLHTQTQPTDTEPPATPTHTTKPRRHKWKSLDSLEPVLDQLRQLPPPTTTPAATPQPTPQPTKQPRPQPPPQPTLQPTPQTPQVPQWPAPQPNQAPTPRKVIKIEEHFKQRIQEVGWSETLQEQFPSVHDWIMVLSEATLTKLKGRLDLLCHWHITYVQKLSDSEVAKHRQDFIKYGRGPGRDIKSPSVLQQRRAKLEREREAEARRSRLYRRQIGFG